MLLLRTAKRLDRGLAIRPISVVKIAYPVRLIQFKHLEGPCLLCLDELHQASRPDPRQCGQPGESVVRNLQSQCAHGALQMLQTGD